MNAEDITSTGIREGILSVISSCSLNETLMHLLSQMPLLSLLWVHLIVISPIVPFLFLLFFYLFPFLFLLSM